MADVQSYAPFDGAEAAEILIPTEADFALQREPEKKRLVSLSFLERMGDAVVSRVLSVFGFAARYLFAAAVVFFRGLRLAFRNLQTRLRNMPKTLSDDVRGFHRDLSMLREGARRNEKNRGRVLLLAYGRYVITSFRRRRGFWKSVRNVMLPLLAVLCVVLTAHYLHSTVPALRVQLNDETVGYAADETVVQQALSRAMEMLPQQEDNAAGLFGAVPRYQLVRVSPEHMQSSNQLCESMLTHAKTSLVHACGIYIDDKFLCAVRNESDAVAAFNSILAPAQRRAEKNAMVSFVEEISYVQGLYPDNEETLWDVIALKRALQSPRQEAQYYTIRPGDTLAAIKAQTRVSAKTLRALNPDVNFEKLIAGRTILTAAQTDYVRVKVMKTRKTAQFVPFETIRRESTSLPRGTTKLSQRGQRGRQVTTELVTYINGKETFSAVLSVQQTRSPVNEVLLVGTNTPFGSYGGYAPSGGTGGFIWPTRGAYSLSSRFGYRSARISGRSFHGGVDIVKPGGHSTGTPVIAAKAGRVVVAQHGYRGYGHTVVIDHGNGLQTRYAHMQPGSVSVRVGQSVYQGQQIGRIGSTGNVTGPHLHFEVLRNGTKVNPLNYIG